MLESPTFPAKSSGIVHPKHEGPRNGHSTQTLHGTVIGIVCSTWATTNWTWEASTDMGSMCSSRPTCTSQRGQKAKVPKRRSMSSSLRPTRPMAHRSEKSHAPKRSSSMQIWRMHDRFWDHCMVSFKPVLGPNYLRIHGTFGRMRNQAFCWT